MVHVIYSVVSGQYSYTINVYHTHEINKSNYETGYWSAVARWLLQWGQFGKGQSCYDFNEQ